MGRGKGPRPGGAMDGALNTLKVIRKFDAQKREGIGEKGNGGMIRV